MERITGRVHPSNTYMPMPEEVASGPHEKSLLDNGNPSKSSFKLLTRQNIIIASIFTACVAATLIALGVLGYFSKQHPPPNQESITYTIWAENTGYGARDNCPPSGDIAFANMSTNLPLPFPAWTHTQAGGIGTPEDPITFAGDESAFPIGTIVYSPRLQKYFIFEDICAECVMEYNETGKLHLDLWLGPDYITKATIIDCEIAITRDNVTMIVNPPPNLPVNPTPLFDVNTNTCIEKITDPCVDDGNECGNSCDLPYPTTCPYLSQLFNLTQARFQALNPSLNCSNAKYVIPPNTEVCMGGTCGD